MANTQLEAVRRLEGEFAEAMTGMFRVGNDLAALRRQLEGEHAMLAKVAAAPVPAAPRGEAAGSGAATIAAPASQAAASSGPGDLGPAAAGPSAAPAAAAAPTPAATPAPKPATPWWQREGMVTRILGAAGAGVLLIGVALLLAFAIQHGYLGPTARVAGAGVLAAALILTAHRVHSDPVRAAGAHAIAAAGYATAYLDVLAATVVYEWIPPAAGLALAGLVAATGVVLARAWRSEFLALIIVAGVAALAPALTSGPTLMTVAFLVVLSTATYPAQLGQSWLYLHPVRVLPAVIGLLAATLDTAQRPVLLALACALAAFELGTALIADRTAGRTAPALLVPLVAVVALPVWMLAQFRSPHHWLVPVLAGVAFLAVAVAARRPAPRQRTEGDPVGRPAGHDLSSLLVLGPWAGATGTALVLGGATGAVPQHSRPLTIAVFALTYAAACAGLGSRAAGWLRGAALVLTGLALIGVSLIVGSLGIRSAAVAETEVGDLLALLATLGAVLLLRPTAEAVARATGTTRQAVDYLLGLLALGLAAAVVVAGGVVAGREMGAPAGGFIFGHGLATLLIAGGAAYLLMHGLRRSTDASLSLRAGLVLAACAVAKLLFFDLAALDGLVRIAAFIGAGLALLAMGAGYARALDQVRRTA